MDLRERVASLMGRARSELAELVAIPSVADPRLYPPEECGRAAAWVRDAFAGAGFSDAWLAEITPRAAARLNLRVPPGTPVGEAAEALVSQLHAAAPWGVHVQASIEAPGPAYQARTGGPAYQAIAAAMHEAYGRPMVMLGDGGSIPLCNVLADTYPGAELILMGVEEPLALIHSPNESVDPAEIAATALTEALFLQRYASDRR